MKPCPICGRPCGSRPENPHGPFCSERCKLIDLGHWLGGDYRIPGKPEEEEDAQSAAEQPDDEGAS